MNESPTMAKIRQFTHDCVNDLLYRCKNSQQDKFHRIFGEVEDISSEDLPHAIKLLERTIKANRV